MGRLGCLIIGAVILVAIGLVLGIGLPKWLGGVDLSSPLATVDSFLDATEAQKAGRMADCCHFPVDYYDGSIIFDNREDFVDFWDSVFAEVDSVKISDLKKQLTNETENKATVHAIYNITADGNTTYMDEYYNLIKVDGNWYITEIHEPW